jgi:hypothetical protein
VAGCAEDDVAAVMGLMAGAHSTLVFVITSATASLIRCGRSDFVICRGR